MTNPFKGFTYMTTHETISVLACLVTAAVGLAAIYHGAVHHDGFYHGLRYIIIGSTVFLAAVVWGAVLAFGHRTAVLTRVYRDGYRQGRKDANHSLLEEGLLLSLDEVAEQMFNEDEHETNGDRNGD